MKRTIPFFLLLFIYSKCFSQNNFQKGYIISNKNDTVPGLIKYGSNYENTYKCSFQVNPDSPVVTYSPGEITAYRFDDGKFFVSKKLNPSDTSVIFLQFLFDGTVDIYGYFDKKSAHYLISKTDNTLQELKNDTRISTINGVKYETESKDYIGVLKTVFAESPSVMKKTENLSLSFNPLIQLAEEYHREVSPDEVYTNYARKRIKTKFSPGLIAGYSASDLLLKVDYNIMERLVLPPLGRGFRLGTFLNIKNEFFNRNLSFQTGLSISNSNHSTKESNLQITTLNLPLQLKLTKPVKKIGLSALAGLNINSLLNFDYTSTSYGNFEIKSGREQLGFIGGLEIEYNTKFNKVISFQIRYEKNSGEHIVQWSGYNYGQWGGLKYDPEHAKSIVITRDTYLFFLLGFRL